jgi:hypothetical protein
LHRLETHDNIGYLHDILGYFCILKGTNIEKLWNSPGNLGLPGNSQDGHFWVIRNWPWNSPGI